MTTIRVFEGPLCCNTGVCGPDVDQRLVEFTADATWASGQGADVVRANLAQDPIAFADNAAARQFVQVAGVDALPLVLVDDTTVLTGRYPSRDELARFAGIASAPVTSLPLAAAGSCCGGSASSGCC